MSEIQPAKDDMSKEADIVTALRGWSFHGYPLMHAAADEIDRIRDERALLIRCVARLLSCSIGEVIATNLEVRAVLCERQNLKAEVEAEWDRLEVLDEPQN